MLSANATIADGPPGMPECDCILAQAVVHLAEAPKSIRVYAGYNKAKALVRKAEAYPVPLHIR